MDEINRPDKFRSDLLQWSQDNLREYPWREPNRSFYEVFIAEFFLTQTPAENVAKLYHDFLSRYPALSDIRAAEVGELAEVIEPIGFHNQRARWLQEIAQSHDRLPRSREELLNLSGVGPYVADATICITEAQGVAVLERNIDRVYDRLFGSEYPESQEEKIQFASMMLPEDGAEARRYNLALIDFGALICEAKSPRCEVCFAAEYCDYANSRL